MIAFVSFVACEETDSGSDAGSGSGDGAAHEDATGGDAADARDATIYADATNADATNADATDADVEPNDAGRADVGFRPLPRDELCDAFTNAYCGAVNACACPASVISGCEVQTRALCTEQILSRRVTAKIDDGTIRYDGFAARGFVDRLATTSTSCANVFTGIGWTAGDYFSIGGIFSGTVRGGDRCTIEVGPLVPSECVRGVCLEEGGNYQCLPLAIPGELCEGAGLCTDLTARLDPSLSISDNLASPCTTSSSIAPSLCSQRFPDGSGCAFDFECSSHHCDGQSCGPRLADSAMCLRDAQCVSGDCGSAAPAICEAGDIPLGMACDRGPSCGTDVCIQNICTPAVCAGFAE